MKKLEDYVRSIPDFPEPGIIFRDITTILQSPESLQIDVYKRQIFGLLLEPGGNLDNPGRMGERYVR